MTTEVWLKVGAHDVQQNGLARVLTDVIHERQRQDEQWGGPRHDDGHGALQWAEIIEHHLGRLGEELVPFDVDGGPDRDRARAHDQRIRRRLVVLAALAVAAIESADRVSERRAELVARLAGDHAPEDRT